MRLLALALLGTTVAVGASPAARAEDEAQDNEAEPGPYEPDLPRISPLSWTADDESWTQSAILDFTAIGVLGASREAGYPELGRLSGGEPEALRLHVGAWGDFGRLAYVARVDIAETLRIVDDDVRERPVAAASRLLDAGYGIARLGAGARLVVGRQPVEVSRFQATPTSLLAAGATPFVIDRVLPARRWGARGKLSAGAIDASVGLWLDGDSVEPRIVVGDPSIGRRWAVSADAAWMLRGERAPHWLASEDRLVLRAAGIVGGGERTRLDALAGLEVSWDPFAVLLESIVSVEDGSTSLSVAGEAEALWHPRSAVFVRGEYDGERDIHAAGGGISYFATDDRRSRLAFYAWRRRDRDGTGERDGAIIELQAEL